MGQADGLDGAVGAFLPLVNGGGYGAVEQELVGVLNGLLGVLAQVCSERDGDAAARTPVEDFTLLNGLAGHFFQAEGLGAELDLVVVPFALLAVFVFDGQEHVAIGFYEVGEACYLQAVGPDPEAAVDGAPLVVGFVADAVGAGLVLECAFEHGGVDL